MIEPGWLVATKIPPDTAGLTARSFSAQHLA